MRPFVSIKRVFWTFTDGEYTLALTLARISGEANGIYGSNCDWSVISLSSGTVANLRKFSVACAVAKGNWLSLPYTISGKNMQLVEILWGVVSVDYSCKMTSCLRGEWKTSPHHTIRGYTPDEVLPLVNRMASHLNIRIATTSSNRSEIISVSNVRMPSKAGLDGLSTKLIFATPTVLV